MIYPIVPFPVILSDLSPRFQGHGVIFMPIDALSVLCAQLTRDLLAIAKFLSYTTFNWHKSVRISKWLDIAYTDVLIAYIDFAKAFDVVLRDKLLQKLVAYGITSDLLR